MQGLLFILNQATLYAWRFLGVYQPKTRETVSFYPWFQSPLPHVIHVHNKTLGEFFLKGIEKERDETSQKVKKSMILLQMGLPGNPQTLLFSQGPRLLLEYLLFDDINQ